MIDSKVNIKNKKFLTGIIILGVALRLFVAVFYVGIENIDQQEYGDIAENIVNGKGYSFYYFEGENLNHTYSQEAKPQPSAYMPPLYTFLIVPIKFIESEKTETSMLVLLNLVIWISTLYVLFKLVAGIFDLNTALIACVIYSLIPEFIYASVTLGTTQLYHLLALLLIYSLYSKSDFKYSGIIFGFLILLRFETFLLIPILSFYIIKKFDSKYLLKLLVIALLFLSPWVLRNAVVFGEFIPFSTSGGLNIYRGNNEEVLGNWHNESTIEFINSFDQSKYIEPELSDKYLDEATEFIVKEPIESLTNFGKKALYSISIYPIDNKTHSPFYYIPWFIILLTSILGFRKNKVQIFCYFILFHLLIAIVFLPLPRYLTMMRLFFIPYSAFYIKQLFKK